MTKVLIILLMQAEQEQVKSHHPQMQQLVSKGQPILPQCSPDERKQLLSQLTGMSIIQ